MRSGSRSEGFTIIETLIVLATTGFLLITAIVVINGRQNATQFSQSVRDTESRVQKVINEVSTGFYPSTGNFSCDGASGQPVLTTTSSAAQGTNSSCIFLGKVVQFSADASAFNVYSVVGVRKLPTGPVTSLLTSRPRLIAQGNAAGDANVPNVFEVETMPYQLTAAEMYYNVAPSPTKYPVWAVGFLSNLASISAGDDSQQIDVYGIPGVTASTDTKTAVDEINRSLSPPGPSGAGAAHTTPAAKNPTGGVKVCLRSGSTNQSALLSIGGQGRQLAVSVDIKNNLSCA